MILAITISAAIGLLLVVIARIWILREAEALSRFWRIVLKVLPFADLPFAIQHRDQAPKGTSLALFGLILIFPVVGEVLWQVRHPAPGVEGVSSLQAVLKSFWKSPGNGKPKELLNEDHQRRLAAKEATVRELSEYLGHWHQSLESRRLTLAVAPGANVSVFNQEAAAYQQLLAVAKDEKQQWENLQAARK